jgi:hypothetical protein
LVTAEAAKSLLSSLEGATAKNVVPRLIDWTNVSSDDAVGNALTRSSVLLDTVKTIPWNDLDLLDTLTAPHDEQAAKLKAALAEALRVDEYVTPLEPAIGTFQREATALLKEALKSAGDTGSTDPTPPLPPPPPPLPPMGGGSELIAIEDIDTLVSRIRKDVADAGSSVVKISWEIME